MHIVLWLKRIALSTCSLCTAPKCWRQHILKMSYHFIPFHKIQWIILTLSSTSPTLTSLSSFSSCCNETTWRYTAKVKHRPHVTVRGGVYVRGGLCPGGLCLPWTDRHLWKHNLRKLRLRAVIIVNAHTSIEIHDFSSFIIHRVGVSIIWLRSQDFSENTDVCISKLVKWYLFFSKRTEKPFYFVSVQELYWQFH